MLRCVVFFGVVVLNGLSLGQSAKRRVGWEDDVVGLEPDVVARAADVLLVHHDVVRQGHQPPPAQSDLELETTTSSTKAGE
jgi:hypothetical protein